MNQFNIIYSNIKTIIDYENINNSTDENFSLLIQYYNSLNEDGQEMVKNIFLESNMIDDSIWDKEDFTYATTGSSTLIVKFMYYIGYLKQFIYDLYHSRYDIKWYRLFTDIEVILGLLDGEDKNIYADYLNNIINNLAITNQRVNELSFHLEKLEIANKITERKLGNIKLQINQLDVEINSDQNKIIELIEEFGLNPEFNKFLTNLKNKDISEEDEIQFAGTIATYREFFSQIIIEIANKMAEFIKEEIPQYQSGDGNKLGEIANCRKYIKEKGNLSDKDNKFINSYIDILHKEGGHNMFSSKDYFRLTKNIGIEILYMLLSKTKEFAKK